MMDGGRRKASGLAAVIYGLLCLARARRPHYGIQEYVPVVNAVCRCSVVMALTQIFRAKGTIMSMRSIADTGRSTGTARKAAIVARADQVASAQRAAEAIAIDEKTARLKALRLAKEAAERESCA